MSVLYLQAVVTDNDGDTATDSLDLGDAISFLDDGPSINTDSDGDAANLVLKDNEGGNTTINFDAGEDGLPGLTFNITSGNAVETIGGETVKFVEPGSTDVYALTWSVSLDNSTVTAEYTDNLGATQTAFDLVLSVSDSSSGTVTADVQQGSFLTEAGFVNFTPSDGVSVSGGNDDYFGLPNISNTQTDVIVSANEGVTKTTVNTTSTTFGVGNAFVNAAAKSRDNDQELVFEFYTNSVTSGSTDTLEFDSDDDGVSDPAETALINNFTFTVENYDSDARYKVEIKVNGSWTDYTTGANAQLVNGTNVLYNPNTVSGVNGITQLAVTNGTDYEAVRITAVTEQTGTSQQYDGGKFKVTVDGIGSLEPIESDIAIRIPINLTDGDGDTTSGTIAFGIDKDDTDPPEVDFNAPIVLDLGTVGVQYVGADDGVNFSSGMNDSINTAWVTPDDGILAIDVNKSGTIDHLNEFVFTEWSESATTDMQAVHEVFDTNKNYFLDEQDYYFDIFYVWQDLNSDGASDPSELLSLSDLGIEKIGLNYFTGSQSRTEADGDVVVFGQSKVYFENGTTTLAEDAAFRYSDSPPQQLFEKNLTIAEIENVESAHIHDVILKVDNPALEREVNSALIVDVIDGKITVGLDTDEVSSGVLSNSVEAFIWIDTTYTNGDNVLEELILEISPTGISDVEFGFDLVEDNATFDNDIVASLAEIANQTSGLEIGASSHFDINYDEINLVHIANTAEDLQDI